jgi:hypothetical protein
MIRSDTCETQCVTFNHAAMTVEKIVQLTLDNIPIVKSDSENEDPDACEKSCG